jgi:Fe-S-cluster containining protein
MNLKEQKNLVEDIKSGKQKTINMNDKIKFDCTMCGKCCFKNDILINSYDMIRLRHALGMTTQEIIQNKFVDIYIGPSSGLPVAILNFEQDTEKLSKCPFLSPAMKIESVISRIEEIVKDPKQLEEIKKEYEIDPKSLLKHIDGVSIDRWICAVHRDRPLICRLFPCGRIKEINKDTKETKDTWIFQEDAKGSCPGMETNKEQSLSDFLAQSNFQQFNEGSAKFQTIIEKLVSAGFFAKTIDNISSGGITPLLEKDSLPLMVAANILYNFDSFRFFSEDPLVTKTINDPTATHEYYMYVLNKIESIIDLIINKYNEIDFSKFKV